MLFEILKQKSWAFPPCSKAQLYQLLHQPDIKPTYVKTAAVSAEYIDQLLMGNAFQYAAPATPAGGFRQER